MQKNTSLSLEKYYYKTQPGLIKALSTLPKEIQISIFINHLPLQQQLWLEKQSFKHYTYVHSAKLNNNSTRLLTTSYDNIVRVFDVQSEHKLHFLKHNNHVNRTF
jgi:hypothetical protein